MLPAEKEAARERQGERTDLRESFPEVEPKEHRARDKIGAFASVSSRTSDCRERPERGNPQRRPPGGTSPAAG